MGLRDKTTPTLTTPLIRANMSSVVATIFSSLDFLSLSISMANTSLLVAASFSSIALLSSSVSTANLSCLLATTFSSLRYLSNSFSSPASIFREWPGAVTYGFLLSYKRFLSPLVPLLALSFPFLSECFFFSVLKLFERTGKMNNTVVTGHF